MKPHPALRNYRITVPVRIAVSYTIRAASADDALAHDGDIGDLVTLADRGLVPDDHVTLCYDGREAIDWAEATVDADTDAATPLATVQPDEEGEG